MKSIHFNKVDNKGISLLELIIAMAIMAVLVAVIVPQYIRFLDKSRRATDIDNAETIAHAFERVLMDNPEFYDVFDSQAKSKGVSVWVDEQVAGEGRYQVYALISSEDFGMFSGTTFQNSPKNSDGKNIYDALNEELGIMHVDTATAQKWQREGVGKMKNKIMVPQYKITKVGVHPLAAKEKKVYGEVDRWRICKNAKTGQLEIWTADGSARGGWPCFRLWPVPCDAYAE
ncbi:MAG: type II secretion system protein [Lachnospiraceae bacterium]|nr:type II secretion system protein [Lachnospiraceae bacterium]